VVDGTILVSVKFHGSALVCFCGCYALLCRRGVLLCSASVKELKCGAGQVLAAELTRMRLEPDTGGAIAKFGARPDSSVSGPA
jgi:hypothetical protein